MNIKILDSWLRDYLQTDAAPKQIAERLSLSSVGIERIEKWKNDFLYDIEITTNRPDLASVVGLAREAGAVLPQSGIDAIFKPPKLQKPVIARKDVTRQSLPAGRQGLDITFDPKLVNRICAVIMEVTVKQSPDEITNRLEASDIRSLNNIIDVTNYVMRTIGHPTHVFDFDKLATKNLHIRESKKGEKVTTLDDKTYTLPGSDLVATDDKGNIVDLLAIMGLKNSVVSNETKRILFFVNNHETSRIRRTSMALGIRTEAAQLNEKGIDPELSMDALLFGIEQYKKIADGKIVSDIIDIYPTKPIEKTVTVPLQKIQDVIGIPIPERTSVNILTSLGFNTKLNKDSMVVTVPTSRQLDVSIPEDIIEEIARVYGYQKIPSLIPTLQPSEITPIESDDFFWEDKIKQAMKYWGFTEVYTYPMVGKNEETDIDITVLLANPLGTDFVTMRQSITPSLLSVVNDNKRYKKIRIFEIANVYAKKKNDLPSQTPHFAGLIKDEKATFFTVKGILEQLFSDLGINNVEFRQSSTASGATLSIKQVTIGQLEILDKGLITFELSLQPIISNATRKKIFKSLSKFPPVFEDITLIVPSNIPTGEVIEQMMRSDKLIKDVTLIDKFQDNRTFHITYQDPEKNLTSEEVTKIREKLIHSLKEKFSIQIK